VDATAPAATIEAVAIPVAIAVEPDDAAVQHEVREAVLAGLVAYNRTFIPAAHAAPLAVAARDDVGTIVGGVVGETLWGGTGDGWLQIAFVWVAEAARGRGLGSRLLHAAEREAARRGCRHAALDTFEFQARPFYERQGYTVFGVQEDFPPGHRRYFLRKTLAGPDAP
jgi:GNAT superfamily N-acetyltransferase